ncbi:Carboxypeptidase G2 precursor [Polystyrenella longa]|uniref:Carboxypeptidase G2 n=1 Tax=Polystyrenella longa TaxID=2528007 RepID=A0A518CM56_9PLAN|nr:M20/M25/M40 family metallo-hydrolase [Polystyrenella longa]QDU80320.1 Carboxypeptidase G2 precursor [Polystyrenella longa]
MSSKSKYQSLPEIKLLTEMMSIPGKSREEAQIAGYIKEKLLGAGLPEKQIRHDQAHKKTVPPGEVGHLIVKLPGTRRGPRRLLMSHMDTVPLCVGCKPIIDGEYIQSADPKTALGADNRSGCAVLLNTLLTILREGLDHPPLTFLWPIQEELGLRGIRQLDTRKLGNPKLCFNWDGRDPNVLIKGATGDIAMTIQIDGIASHAGVHPEEGVNALMVASLALADLQENGWHGLIEKGKQRGTSNAGIVEGGNATNVVMSHFTLHAESRSHNAKFRQRIVDQWRKSFEKAIRTLKNIHGKKAELSFETYLKYESFCLEETEPTLLAAKAAIEKLKMKPFASIANGGLDANWMTEFGFPTVTLGAGQMNPHTVREQLHIPSFLTACQVGQVLATATEND